MGGVAVRDPNGQSALAPCVAECSTADCTVAAAERLLPRLCEILDKGYPWGLWRPLEQLKHTFEKREKRRAVGLAWNGEKRFDSAAPRVP